jgi:hypothetical protein
VVLVESEGMSAGSAVFMNKQLAPNVIFVSPGSKSKTFQEAPGLATQAPRLPFDADVANMIKSLPDVKDVVPVSEFTSTTHSLFSRHWDQIRR